MRYFFQHLLQHEFLAKPQQALYILDVLILSLLFRDQAEVAQFETTRTIEVGS